MASPSPRLPPGTITFCIGHYRSSRNPAASVSPILSNSRYSITRSAPSDMNPAALSIPLGTLFPPGAVAADLRGPGNPELLLAGEATYLGRAVPQRVQEFAAGRLCARRALAEFGIVDFPIEMAGDRQPIWPDSIVGSITHTRGYGAAVVAERRSAAALGLDSEVVGDVNAEVRPRICVP